MNDSLGYSDLPPAVVSTISIYPEEKKLLTPPIDAAFPEEEAAALKNMEKHFNKQQLCVKNMYHEWFVIYPFYNPDLKRLHPADQLILDRYAENRLVFPVGVTHINSVKGNGLKARRPIKKGELVATYSGNVMALSQVAKYGDRKTN
jgi:hypothetical protein